MILKKISILSVTLLALLGVGFDVSAQGINPLEQWKSTTTPFSAITTRSHAKNIYIPFSVATTSKIYSTTYCINNITPDCITAWPTGGGGAGNWFTPYTGYNGTSTAVGFLAGLFSNSSTTINGSFRLPSLSDGGLGVNSGLVYSGATTTFSSPLVYTAGNVNCPTCVTGSGGNSKWATTTGDGSIEPNGSVGILVNRATSTITNLTMVNSTSTNATTTSFSISGILSSLLKTNSIGSVVPAVSGTDYEVPVTAGDGLTRTVNDFDCDTASGSVFGCLSSADWTTFNNKGTGNVGTGAIGQVPYYAAAGTDLTATSNVYIATTSFVGIGTQLPLSQLEVNGNIFFSSTTQFGQSRRLSVATSTSGTVPSLLFITNANGFSSAMNGGVTGGALTVSAGAGGAGPSGNGGGAGGALALTGGAGAQVGSGGSGAGGAVTITAGAAAGSTAGASGGAITVTGGAGSGSSSAAGGGLTFVGGAAAGSGSNGGAFTVTTGAGAGTGLAGAVAISVGASGSNAAGGTVTITSGTGVQTGAGGLTTISSGNGGSSSGSGGAITINAGNGVGSGASGGIASLFGGNGGSGNSAGGDVYIYGGAKSGSGTDGDVLLNYTGSAFRGFVGIGTSSPYAPLSVVGSGGVVAQLFHATSTVATSTIAGGFKVGSTTALEYDWYSGVTNINNLVTGPLSFDNDAGIVSWADLPLTTSGAANGSVQSYSASLNGTSTLTIYGVANGLGSIDINTIGVGIGTTTPAGTLSVQGQSAASATKGTCFRAKDVGANTFTYWWYKAGVQTLQTTTCMGNGTTTVTYD